jgi:ribosomal protein S12 methylthiotransferase accessory factor
MHMEMSFPGGLEVNAEVKGFTVRTDQPEKVGGGGTAPAPFDLFLASIGTCAGLYVLQFCQKRDIDTSQLGVSMETIKDPETRRIATIRIDVRLPEGFPEKYIPAVRRAVDLCAVKRHILEPPEFVVEAKVV